MTPKKDLLCTLFGTLPTNVQSVGVGPEGQVGSRSAALMRLASVEALVGSGWAWMLTYALQRFSWVNSISLADAFVRAGGALS